MTNPDLLDATQLSQVLATTHRDLFRMETLPSYDVPINGNDFERWLAGEPEPTWETKQPWMDTLTRWAQEGRPRRRVRVIHDPITEYERYACDWGYRLNEQAGENIRVLDLAETSPPPELQQAPGDWWLIDDREVVAMHYYPDGRFMGARRVVDPRHVSLHSQAAAVAWDVAVPFGPWWQAHSQHHHPTRRMVRP